MISVRPASWPANFWPSIQTCQKFSDFLRYHNCDNCQTLHDGFTHWALPVHATFSDIGDISELQQY